MTLSFARAVGAAILLAVSLGAAASSQPRFEQLEEDLKIRPEQKMQYDLAVGSTKRALLSVALTAMRIKQRLAEEIMKPRPDFRAFVREQEDLVEQNRPLFKEAGEQWQKLYAILDDEQVAIAKSFVRDNLRRLLQ